MCALPNDVYPSFPSHVLVFFPPSAIFDESSPPLLSYHYDPCPEYCTLSFISLILACNSVSKKL